MIYRDTNRGESTKCYLTKDWDVTQWKTSFRSIKLLSLTVCIGVFLEDSADGAAPGGGGATAGALEYEEFSDDDDLDDLLKKAPAHTDDDNKREYYCYAHVTSGYTQTLHHVKQTLRHVMNTLRHVTHTLRHVTHLAYSSICCS